VVYFVKGQRRGPRFAFNIQGSLDENSVKMGSLREREEELDWFQFFYNIRITKIHALDRVAQTICGLRYLRAIIFPEPARVSWRGFLEGMISSFEEVSSQPRASVWDMKYSKYG
jgi:hypothetical protein